MLAELASGTISALSRASIGAAPSHTGMGRWADAAEERRRPPDLPPPHQSQPLGSGNRPVFAELATPRSTATLGASPTPLQAVLPQMVDIRPHDEAGNNSPASARRAEVPESSKGYSPSWSKQLTRGQF